MSQIPGVTEEKLIVPPVARSIERTEDKLMLKDWKAHKVLEITT